MVSQHSEITKLFSARSALSQVPFTPLTHPCHRRGVCVQFQHVSSSSQALEQQERIQLVATSPFTPLHFSLVWLNSLACLQSGVGGGEGQHRCAGDRSSMNKFRRRTSMDPAENKVGHTGGSQQHLLPMLYKESPAIQALSDQSHYRHLSCEGNLECAYQASHHGYYTSTALFSLVSKERKTGILKETNLIMISIFVLSVGQAI